MIKSKSEKPRKIRKNRFKKGARRKERRWPGRIFAGLKLFALMLLLLAASALFMAGYAAVTQSDYFRTEKIKIKGNLKLSPQQVLDQAGIRSGDNLLALNLHLVRERLLANPWIDEAQVVREIPETIVISVQEHHPLARVDLGKIFLMNTDGRIFKEAEETDAEALPLITGIEYADISLEENGVSKNIQAIIKVLDISKCSRSPIVFDQLDRIHLDSEMGITLTLKENELLINLGFDDYEQKFSRFKQLRRLLQSKKNWHGFKAVDLNNPERVVVQFG